MEDNNVDRVSAPTKKGNDIPTVPRGSGAPLGDDTMLQGDLGNNVGEVSVRSTEAAQRAAHGESPYPHSGVDEPRS